MWAGIVKSHCVETFAAALSDRSVFLIRETSTELHFYFSGLSWKQTNKKA